MVNNAVEAEGLTVRRSRRTVLDGIDLAVPAGTVTGLLGPSGCGKTTLMRTIVGVQQIAAGSVRCLGRPAGHRDLRSRIGYVTQAPSVYDDLSVAENLRFFGRVLGAPTGAADTVLATVDLEGFADRPVARLSGGQRSRVSLAVALLNSPSLLVLDEPTVGLDPVLREQLWNTFHVLAQGGTTVFVSSHVMDEAERCDRLLLMRDGRLIADDTPAGLLAVTGGTSTEDAFLRIVRGEPAAAPDSSPPGPAPRHRATEVAR